MGKGFQLARYNEYYGSPDAISEELQKVLDVNISDVKRVYEKYIKDQNYVMTNFVPKGKLDLVAEGSVLFPVKEEKIVENIFNTQKQFSESLNILIENYTKKNSQLNELTIKYLATADFLGKKLPKDNFIEWSPAIMCLCK